MHAQGPRTKTCLLALTVLLVAACANAGERRYQVLRHAEDWSWLSAGAEDPKAFDAVKYADLGGDWYLTFGGSFRIRFESDDNRTLGASPVTDDDLVRTRTFLSLDIGHAKNFRWFGEFRYSDTQSSGRPVGGIWRDDPDVQNFFFEGTFGSQTKHPVSLRVGRQELLFGAQRLVSPLDWSNTRRTFDGVSVIVKTPRTKTTIFGTHPVRHEINDFDSPQDRQLFAGVYSTFKPEAGHAIDAYWLLFDDDRKIFAAETTGAIGDAARHTWGLRYTLNKNGWLADAEMSHQSGEISTDDIDAWSLSLTAGYQWKDAAWKPKVVVGVDIATGDGDPTDGDREMFSQLFPLGHAFFGHLDLVARQNVEAARLQVVVSPVKGFTWVTTVHRFSLENRMDALYHAGGGVVRKDPTGSSGDDVATELDVLFKYAFKGHHTVAAEFARWWSDDFIENTGSPDDATFFWLGYEFKF